MQMYLRFLWLTTVCCSYIYSAHAKEALGQGPAFDCGAALTNVEKTICANSELSILDLKLSQVFNQAQAESAGINGETGERVDPLAAEQKQWIEEDRNICDNIACLKLAYQTRIKEIELTWLTK